MTDMTKAAADVLAERKRQVEKEGWSHAHDDAHGEGELATAAACYAASERIFVAEERAGRGYEPHTVYCDAWPWDDKWWKPSDRRRNLVRAGALILAEIERFDRASANKPAADVAAEEQVRGS